MQHIILDPVSQTASLVSPSILEGHDLTGKTVLDVADTFTWHLKKVDWSTLTIVVDLTPLWNALRLERDRRLTATDKYALEDYPISAEEKALWFAYRQALRELPQNTTDPSAPEWPDQP